MPPKARNKENKGLPKRWRHRNNKYRYMVPKGQEQYWDGKKEFTLGATLSEAHRVFAERILPVDYARTLDQLIDRYLVEVTPTKSIRTRSDEPALFSRLRTIFQDTDPNSIRPFHIYQVYDALKANGLTSANRHMEKLSHLFTKCIEWGVIHDHPMTNKKFVKTHAKPPKIYITDDQVERALQSAPELIYWYVRLKLLTGLRMTDMLSLRWSDWQDNVLTVIPSKTRNSTGVTQEYIGDELTAVMGALRKLTNFHIREHVFVNREGRSYIKPNKMCRGFQSMWKRWMVKVEAQHGFKFNEKQLRVKVGSDQKTTSDTAELLGHSDEKVAKKHYRAKPIRLETGKKP